VIDNTTPYADLEPNVILNAIESIGFCCNGNLLVLNSYENRVYQIGITDEEPIIAKFYRPGRWSSDTIIEEHQFATELNEHEIPVVAPWHNKHGESLFQYQQYRFSIFPRFKGRALELDSFEQLAWMGRFIGRLHAVGATKLFQHRPVLTAKTYGYNSFEFLIKNNFIPPYLLSNYSRIVEKALEKIDLIYTLVGPVHNIRLHGDIHAGNVLWNDVGPHIVDLDDCLTGPAIQDIWMLLSGDESQMKLQIDKILSGYCEFFDFNYRELYLIEALRTLRQLCYTAWLANRWHDPAFPVSFPWFNTSRFWEEQVQNLAEQFELLERTADKITEFY